MIESELSTEISTEEKNKIGVMVATGLLVVLCVLSVLTFYKVYMEMQMIDKELLSLNESVQATVYSVDKTTSVVSEISTEFDVLFESYSDQSTSYEKPTGKDWNDFRTEIQEEEFLRLINPVAGDEFCEGEEIFIEWESSSDIFDGVTVGLFYRSSEDKKTKASDKIGVYPLLSNETGKENYGRIPWTVQSLELKNSNELGHYNVKISSKYFPDPDNTPLFAEFVDFTDKESNGVEGFNIIQCE